MWAGFFFRQDVSISIFGGTKEFSEVRGTSLMCYFGVHSRFLDVIYGVRPPNGSPDLWYWPGPLAEFRRIPMHCLSDSSYRSRQQLCRLQWLKQLTPNHDYRCARCMGNDCPIDGRPQSEVWVGPVNYEM